MRICVSGWDYNEDFLAALREIHSQFDVTIINHRSKLPAAMFNGIVLVSTPNVGLEFGCYDYFLKTAWDRKSDVLFCHDDIRVSDPSVFEKISKITADQAYIWRDKAERMANGGKHGRAIFCSARFLRFIRDWECNCPQGKGKNDRQRDGRRLKGTGPHCGFWFDPMNTGHTTGTPPEGMRHYNDAIYHFHWMLGRIRDQKVGMKKLWPNPKEKMLVVQHKYFPGFEAGRRNTWNHKKREQKKYGSETG